MLQIDIDSESGFCFGVTSAIRKAEEELAAGRRLYCLGDIVHNGQEVKRLADMGLVTIDYDDLRTLHNVRVLLRAHGEPPSTYHIAEQNDIEIVDASCPVVRNLQKRIRETFQNHRDSQIVIFGKTGHAEVIGLQGQTNNTAIVVESLDKLQAIDFSKDIYLFSQTTKSVNEFNLLVEKLQSLMQPNAQLFVHDTICRQVRNRVQHLQEFALAHDMVVFVGGKKSSNAKVLFEHCKAANPRTIFVSSADELTEETRQSVKSSNSLSIGICGATSTPLWLMEEVKEALAQIALQ